MAIEPNILQQIQGQHPARRMDFDTLYAGLKAEIAAENIHEIVGPNGLTLYSYTINCQFSNAWNVFSLIARGLVLDVANKKVVATPFPKFFNHGELPVNFPNGTVSTYTPDETFEVTEKMDGSLGIVFRYNHQLYAITRGSFQSEQAKWAIAWLEKNAKTSLIVEGVTFLFEIIYPENRVVIPYDFSAMVMLACYGENGYEFKYDVLTSLGKEMGVRVAERHSYTSLDEMLQVATNLDWQKEGWVIRFENGYRVKIKGDPYCRLHRLMSNVTPNRVWEMMIANDDLEAIRKDLPEELRRDFDLIVEIFDRKLAVLMTDVRRAWAETKHLSDKECGLLLSQNFDRDSAERNFIFPARKLDFFNEVNKGGSTMRKKAFKFFEPKGNKLDGYVPSSSMNRFDEVEA